MSRSSWWRWLDTLPAWRPEHWCARKLHDEERQARRYSKREGLGRPELDAPGLPVTEPRACTPRGPHEAEETATMTNDSNDENETATPRAEGWIYPHHACRKAHYIRDGISLCGKWGYLGHEGMSPKLTPTPNDDECLACWRKRDAQRTLARRPQVNTKARGHHPGSGRFLRGGTMSGDTPGHSLGCPGCGSEVFTRDIAVWYTDEDEHCPGCGSRVIVALDEDDADPDLLTARVYVYEHGGEVVVRLRAEVARLRERVRIAESPVMAKVIIAAWSSAGDKMWADQPADTPAAICLDGVDLASFHGSPTEATPMTGPEFIAAIEAAHARGDFTPDGLKRLRAGVRRARGETPGGEQP